MPNAIGARVARNIKMISTFSLIRAEAQKADKKFGHFASTHEGYGVLSEEVAELLEAIRSNRPEEIKREAIHVSAVAARIHDSCDDSACAARSLLDRA